ncbi:MAG: ribonuclease Z [Nanoarchaeota archaeon]
MEKLKITFLGTGNAIPTEKRNHTGILINFLNESILVDCGEGIQRQFKIAGISPAKLTKILITHWHGDHILGLPGLFQTLAMSGYNKTLKIYGPHGTKRFISLIKELLMNIRINIEAIELSDNEIIKEKNFIINSYSMSHGTPSLAYSIKIPDRIHLEKNKIKKFGLPNSSILGELQRGKDIVYKNKKVKAKSVTYTEKGKKIAIILDTAMNNNAFKTAKDADILIAESTFSSKEKEKAREYLHLTASQAAIIAKKAKAKKLILTHISQRYEHNTSIIEKEAKKIFKNISIAKDFNVVTV